MASKKTKTPAGGDDIDELFEGLNDNAVPKKSLEKKTKPTTAASKAMADQDILAELEKDIEQPSRPHTPRIKETAVKGPPRRSATPTVDDKAAAPRKSTDSARSLRASFTPSATSSDLQESDRKPEQPAAATASTSAAAAAAPAAGGGWWGGIFSTASATATAAMKQAEAAVKEIQKNEEAKKWAEQVRGNVGGLRALGDNLRQQALPTFTNILHTLAPPISSHERLLIHIAHDMVGYPSLDPLIYGTFSRVMSQVEGGELMVIQRGQENTSRRHSNDGAGWRDGPWWRQSDAPRDLGLIKGLTEGTKLCRAGAEGYANEFFAANGGLEQARTRAIEPVSEENPVRSSDLFLAIQAIGTASDSSLFSRTSAVEREKEASAVADPDDADELVCFAVFCLDPVHDIEYSAISQSIPAKWIQWLDAAHPLTPASGDDGQEPSLYQSIPDEIREIVDGGGVDPREWVAEWIEEVLGLAVGIVAQRYVARRMGVGEGGIGKGKRRVDEVLGDGGGEAARAGLI
ncbi:Maintenance of telomere capping protein 1 [Colletotrichum orbiculare MAFF 240422]|uniref:Maintenance of telomere capping protein 1 n=1 Tax=Colletotrichum orbiculare (strain 104-T / ATCC 96160 / CBS 514.97 / LARS 414 / MAFF 240422) TaxID=1213857 RepID=N4V935_COLOR|nr:Maintenance of telomere capping protein 1 [Colletotrichum orbiculare MAFF 240422]